MPVIAVAAGAYAAGTIATTGIAAMTAFEVIAAVGAITSGIGALTGNDTLMKIGAVAGLAGGVGAFAQGKGWLATGDAMNTAGAEGAATSTTKALTQTAAPGVETAGGAFDSAAFEGLTQETAGLQGAVDGSIAQNLTSQNPMTQEMGVNARGLIDAANPNINAKDTLLARGSVQSPLDAPSSIFDSIKGFTKELFFDKDGKLDKGMASMAGNFIGGMFDEEKEAKAEYYKTAADTAKQKMANASAVPNMNFKLKQSGTIWKPTSPTYNAPRPSGLFYAK